jgi:endo-1,4-beta-xylanase
MALFRAFLRALNFGLVASAAASSTAALMTVTMFSPSNGRDLSFQVYTPPGYETGDTRYPAVYSLHGIGGTSLQRASSYAPTLEQRMSQGALLPMIWVFPHGQTNSFYGDAFDGHKQVYSHIVDEIVAHIDATFKTRPLRASRALEGFSMGGFGAALYAARRPDLFSAVVEYGGALSTWETLVEFNSPVAAEMYDNVEANWLPYSLWDRTASSAAAIRSLVNYKMIVGDADPQLQSNIRFRNHLTALGIEPHFQQLPGVTHVSDAYLNEGSGLEFLDQHFATPYPHSGDFDGDDRVDGADLLIWQRQLGAGAQGEADGNTDGVVNELDLIIWRGEFGHELIPTISVPEPSSAPLAGAGITAMAVLFTDARKRRPRFSCLPAAPSFPAGTCPALCKG